MSKFVTPLKIVTPKNKRFGSLYDMDFLTLDVSGRSYSPQNLQDYPNNQIQYMNHTIGSMYQNKKFKVRTASNFVKTTRNWKNLPYQRIRKVQNAINQQKLAQKVSINEKGTILPQFNRSSSPLSPRTTQKTNRNKDLSDLHKKVEMMRLKQIQQLIKSGRQQSKERKNIIKFQQKLNSLQANELIVLSGSQIEGYIKKQRQQSFRMSKGSTYAQMVRNRKKLSQKRQVKKKVIDHSLLGRINNLQQHQEINFVLRNSFDKSRLQKHD